MRSREERARSRRALAGVAVAVVIAFSLTPAAAGDRVPPTRAAKKAQETRENLGSALSRADQVTQGALAVPRMAADGLARRAVGSMSPGQMPRVAGHVQESRIIGRTAGAAGNVFTGASVVVKCSGVANGTDQGDCAQAAIDVGAGKVGEAAISRYVIMRGGQALMTGAGGAVAASGLAGSLIGEQINDHAHTLIPALGGRKVNEYLTAEVYIPMLKPAFDAHESLLNLRACGYADCTSQQAIDAHGRNMRDRNAAQRIQQAVQNGEPWALELRDDLRKQADARAAQAVREASNPLEILESAIFKTPASAVGQTAQRDLSLRPEELVQQYDPQASTAARSRMSGMRQAYMAEMDRRQQAAAEAAAAQAATDSDDPGRTSGTGSDNGLLDLIGTLANAAVTIHQRGTGEPQGGSPAGAVCTLDPATGCHPGHDEQAHPGGCKCR